MGIGMSKNRIQCTIAGKEMEESSNTDTDDEDDDMEVEGGDGRAEYREEEKEDVSESDEENEGKCTQSTVSKDPRAATSLKRTQRIAFGKKVDEPEKKKVILSTGKTTIHERIKGKSPKPEAKPTGSGETVGEEKGKTLMELLELEMRARAIKALLMKAGKEEGEAESLAIEEALEEAKEKEKDKDSEKEKGAESTQEEKNDEVAEKVDKAKGSEDEEMEVEDEEKKKGEGYQSSFDESWKRGRRSRISCY